MIDLTPLSWTLTGWRPYAWHLGKSMETGWNITPDVAEMPVTVPGSAQYALLQSGIVRDWHVGLQSRECEWTEHRHWDFSANLAGGSLPTGDRLFLRAEGLDYSGWLLIDAHQIGRFDGSQTPHEWEVTEQLGNGAAHQVSFVFDSPPEDSGQFGYTSASKFFKPRYNFGWDWCPRLAPIGIWDVVTIETGSQRSVRQGRQTTELAADNAFGTLRLEVEFDPSLAKIKGARVEAILRDGDREITRRSLDLIPGHQELVLDNLDIAPWWPNGSGAQQLYDLELIASSGERELWTRCQRVGFKRIEWQPCEGAPEGAESWICVVNGQPVFLQGVNWTPVRMTYHDTTDDDYRTLVNLYREMGCNTLRVWGGAFLEKAAFYTACDEAGLLVWQEFPLSSSGIDNWPPEDSAAIAELRRIAISFVQRRRSHVSLLLWCGGNELQSGLDGSKDGIGKPVDLSHPAIAALSEVVAEEDPGRRFLPSSASGPRFTANAEDFGKGLHHDVHGPWGLSGMTMEQWQTYWESDDALFRSEVGMTGAQSLEQIQLYSGGEAVWPPTTPLWMHSCPWWTQWSRFEASLGGLPAEEALPRYVEITRAEQAEALGIAARTSKARFPRCGGFLLWMGHDCYPCLSNNSVIDFERQFKPAAYALQTAFRGE